MYGPGTDVWSCGVVLFEMLTGSSFFPLDEEEIQEAVEDLERYVMATRSTYLTELQAHGFLKNFSQKFSICVAVAAAVGTAARETPPRR